MPADISVKGLTTEELSKAIADATVAATTAVAKATTTANASLTLKTENASANANGFKADRVVTEGYLQANYAKAHDYLFCLREISFEEDDNDLSAFSVQELTSILDPNGCDLAMMPLIKFTEHTESKWLEAMESLAKAIMDVVIIEGWSHLTKPKTDNDINTTSLHEHLSNIISDHQWVSGILSWTLGSDDPVSTLCQRIIEEGNKVKGKFTNNFRHEIMAILHDIFPNYRPLKVTAANIMHRLKSLGLPIDVTIWFDNENLKQSVRDTKFISELTDAGYSVGYFGGGDCACPQGNGNVQNGSIVLDNVQCGPKTEAGGGIQTFTIGDNGGPCKIRWIKPQ
ncbi:hypothetical protein F0223_17475 [Vibrio coralliilyticus]|uniref:hypothetical protein n=1 Tax=Vibrio TaxID=662 RepID=UPI00050270C1|nr:MULTISPECIES: hypothetical protein [Vibrio]KFI10740.1 hypothetical protein IX95_18015 [Vibrio sp. B183]NOI20017.1 hypothetical protein [Vibrio coralliilyticus]